MKKNKNIDKKNILLEQYLIIEKIGEVGLIEKLNNEIQNLTNKVSNGESQYNNELKNKINQLIDLLKDDTLTESSLTDDVLKYSKNTLLAGLIVLGMSSSQAQEKLKDIGVISSTNQSAVTHLSNETKIEITNTINQLLNKDKEIKQIVISITGIASQVTPPKGITNDELALKRADEAKTFIEAKYGNKVVISSVQKQIGSTKYSKGKDIASDNKFTKEQGVKINFKVAFGSSLIGDFNSLNIFTGKNPDNLSVYSIDGTLITSTGFIGSGDAYHPHFILTTTLGIKNNPELKDFNQQFTGTFDELKSLLTQPNGENDTYYKKALNVLMNLHKQNKPIYLYKLTDNINLDLSTKGTVMVKVITIDKDTEGSVNIKTKDNTSLNSNYDVNGFKLTTILSK